MTGDMVQIHMLTSYPATLLNRDDAGLAKRVPFGGVLRTRVSSQCLKKHWREASELLELGPVADRSTRIYEVRVARPLIEDHGAAEEEATAIAKRLMGLVDTKAEKKDEPLQTGQLLVLTRAETEFLAEIGVEMLAEVRDKGIDVTKPKALDKMEALDKDLKKRIAELPASIDTALFGRMVTSDNFARVDAAVSVAHALTTHEEAAETDYFTAVDTLKTAGDDAGAGLIQDTELTSGVFYLYAVIDMNQLRDNLGSAAVGAEQLARSLVRVMATKSPGAKKGSTAPYAYAELALLERGVAQPRTLANAFREPISGRGTDLMAMSVARLLEYRTRLEGMYGESGGAVALSTIHTSASNGFDPVPFQAALDAVFEEG
ncbi:MAG: type I-E CRISPR-associated protein Cas7/Cse4/CasC [Longimicrobiales bacterium]